VTRSKQQNLHKSCW